MVGSPPPEILRISRVFPTVKKERVFRAWTEPEELKRWWRPAEGWTTPLAEVDLRVGGKFALGAQPPSGELHLVRGKFLEVEPPDKLIYTWLVEGANEGQSLVTVEFHSKGRDTEVTILHQQLTGDAAVSSGVGWEGVLGSLEGFLGRP